MPCPHRGPRCGLFALILLALTGIGLAQTATRPALTLAGLRTTQHAGGFRAATYLADGSIVLLEDANDGIRLLKADAALSHVLAEVQLGTQGDHGLVFTQDGAGSLYVGGTSTGALAGTGGAAFPQRADSSINSFLASFDSDLHVKFVSFLGAGHTALTAIAATPGAVFVTGVTYSQGFPATPGALLPQPVPGNRGDGFLASFSPDGATLRYATYLGGPGGPTSPAALAADPSGAVLVAGSTAAVGFPTADAMQPSLLGTSAGFLAKLDPTGSQLVFSTFVAGTGLSSVAISPASGDILASGNLDLGLFPVTNVFAPIAALPYQALLRLSGDGQTLRSSTLLEPGTTSNLTAAPDGSTWITGPLTLPLTSQDLAAGVGDSYALPLDSHDNPGALFRFGGNATNHPAYASLTTIPGPPALSAGSTQILLPATLSAHTDPAFASSQVFDLTLTAPNALLPSALPEVLPATCGGLAPCSGSAGFLLQLTPGAQQPSLGLATGDLPNVIVRNPGPATVHNLALSASTNSLVSGCLPELAAGAQCGLVLDGSGDPSLTASATDAPPLTIPLELPAAANAPPLVFSVASLDFGLVPAASPAVRTVTVTNLGTVQQTFASGPVDLPLASNYSLTESGSTCAGAASAHKLAAGASCVLTLTLAPGTDPAGDGPLRGAWQLGARTLPLTGWVQAASLTVSATHLDFGLQAPGPARLPRYLYLSNATGAPATHAAVLASAGSPFQVTDNCPATLQPNAVCQLAFTYNQPLAPAFDGLTLPLDGGLSVLLTGQTLVDASTQASLAPTPFLASPDTVAFEQPVAVTGVSTETQVITVTNTSAQDQPLNATVLGDFLLNNTCPATLPAQGTCSLGLQFTPGQTGLREGLLILSGAPGTRVLSVPVSGTAVALFTLPASIKLGETSVHEPVTQWFQLGGSTPQHLTATVTGQGWGVVLLPRFGTTHGTVSSSNFGPQVTADCLRCWLGVQLLPPNAGQASGSLTLTTNPAGLPFQAALTAYAQPTEGLRLSPAAANFGAVPQNSASAPMLFTLTNQAATGPGATLQRVTVTGDFVLSPAADSPSCTGTLNPTAACPIYVSYRPSTRGTATGLLTVVTDAGTVTAQLSGAGTPDPGLAFNPAALVFGPTLQRTVTVTNTGQSPIDIGTPALSSSAFSASSGCGALAPGAACELTVSLLQAASDATLSLPVTIALSPGATTRSTYALPLTAQGVTTPQGLALFPAQADFGAAATGALGPSRTFTLTNNGSSSLTLGFAASHDFPLIAPPGCPTLRPAESCTLTVLFRPALSGALDETLTVHATAPGASAPVDTTLYLDGYGIGSGSVAADAGTDPLHPLVFPTVSAGEGAVSSLSLQNAGSAPLFLGRLTSTYPFQAASQCPATLAAGATCSLTLNYLPQSPDAARGAQVDQGTLVLETDAGSGPLTIYLTATTEPLAAAGSSTAASSVLPALTLSATSLTFPDTAAGATAPAQTVVITNTSGVPVTLAPISTAAEFPLTTDCGTVAPSSICHLSISFQPQASSSSDDLHLATLSLTSAGATPLDFLTLLGSSGTHLELSAQMLQFGSVPLGSSAQLTLTLTNISLRGIPLLPPGITDDFSIAGTTCPAGTTALPPGQSCSWTLAFTPQSVSEHNGLFTVSSPTLAAPLQVTLAGIGVGGRLALAATSLDFGSVFLGDTARRTLTLTNAGSAPLTGLAVALHGSDGIAFTVAQACPQPTLAPGATCTLQLAFAPATPATYTASLTLTSGDPSGPAQVALTGVGVRSPGFAFLINGGPTAQTTLAADGTATFALSALSRGSFASALRLSCTSITPAPNLHCLLSASEITMAGPNPATATVTLTTSASHNVARPGNPWSRTAPAILLLLPWSLRRRRFGRGPALLLASTLVMASASLGCADAPVGTPYTPSGTYTYQVTATPVDGSLPPASVTLTLLVP